MRRTFVFVAVFLALVTAPTAPMAARVQDANPDASPAAGIVEATIDVGGRGLHLACIGSSSDSPPVLLEVGGPATVGGAVAVAEVGPFVAPALGTRFCAYDRANTGQSDPDPAGVRSFAAAAADLLAVLASPALGCPCVVIGESLGGGLALTALAEDPTDFAGLVLLDTPPPGYFDRELELASPIAGITAADLANAAGENEERLDVVAGFRALAAPAEPPAIPVVVVTHGVGGPPPACFDCPADYPTEALENHWQADQADLAQALGARLVVAEGVGHSIATEDPGLVVGLVGEVLAAVRDPSTWATPTASPVA